MGGKVLAIIGARLNSSRLPNKHLLELGGKPMIARIVDRLKKSPAIDQITLATTADDYNQPLISFANSYDIKAFGFEGDVDDLMGRIDALVRQENPEIILYICGDCPLINPETLDGLIEALQNNPSAEVAHFSHLPEGKGYIHEGFDIYRRSFWDKMMSLAVEPFEREHVGAVYHALNKLKPNAIAFYDEDIAFSDIQHRISVDTPSDYTFMQRVYTKWYEHNAHDSIVSLKWVMAQLLDKPDLAAINQNVHQKTVMEKSAAITILTQVGKNIGLGHLSRMINLAHDLQNQISAGVHLLIHGGQIDHPALKHLPHTFIDDSFDIDAALALKKTQVFIFDIKNDFCQIQKRVNFAKKMGAITIAIDDGASEGKFDQENIDLYFIPSIFVPQNLVNRLGDRLLFGLNCMLLPHLIAKTTMPEHIKKIIVLSGGSDPTGLGATLPKLIDETLKGEFEITWVEGPYAKATAIPKNPNLTWQLWQNPTDLAQKLKEFDLAITAFGISFYECLKSGVPTIVYDEIGAATVDEWQYLQNQKLTITADNAAVAVKTAAKHINDTDDLFAMAEKAKTKMQVSGGKILANRIKKMLVESS